MSFWDRLPIFIGTYTERAGHALGQSDSDPLGDGIYVAYLRGDGVETRAYSFTERSAKLAHEPGLVGPCPAFLRVITLKNSLKKKMYATNEVCPDGALQVFDVNTTTHRLSTTEMPVKVKGAPCYIGVSPCQRFITVPNYMGGNCESFRLDEDHGRIALPVADMKHGDKPRVAKSNQNPHRQEAEHPHCFTYVPPFLYAATEEAAATEAAASPQVAASSSKGKGGKVDPKIKVLYGLAADLGTDEILQFEQQGDTGSVREIGRSQVKQGAGPRHIVIHPSGKWVYCLNELHCSIAVFALDAQAMQSGNPFLSQTPFHSVSVCPQGWKQDADQEQGPLYRDLKARLPYYVPANAADIHCHPTLPYIYASCRGFDRIVHFACDASTGTLTLVRAYPCKGNTPRNFCIVPDGSGRPDHYLLVLANQDSHNVAVWSIDVDTGALHDTGAMISVPFPAVLAPFPFDNFHPGRNAPIASASNLATQSGHGTNQSGYSSK